MDYFDEKLNQIKEDENQYKAFISDKNTVVIAGPGSGKTTVLTIKIMQLLKEKIKEPYGLACVTYSREAAKEFKDRLKKLGYQKRNNVFLGTLHSFCIAEVISPFAKLFDYGIPLPIRIVPTKVKRRIFNSVLNDLQIKEENVSIEEMDKERSLSVDGISDVSIPSYDLALRVANKFETMLHSLNYIDYIDIVKYSTRLIQNEPLVRNCLSAKFPWVVIDEYQDLGKPLHEMVLSLFKLTDMKFFIVGDPDQSIYSFQGAIPDYLHELYSNNNFESIRLIKNYRSNQEIIDGSEIVLDKNNRRNYQAGFKINEEAEYHFIECEEDMFDQYKSVIEEVIPACINKGISYEEICVIVGNNREVKELSKLLEENNIPFYIPRHDFDRSEVVRWLEKCALWVSNSNEQSFDEIFDFWNSLLVLHNVSVNTVDPIINKIHLYETLLSSKVVWGSLKSWLEYLFSNLKLLDMLRSSTFYPDEEDNLNKLLEVLTIAPYNSYNIMKFGNLGKPENQVTITTRHSSKGLEFDVVAILGLDEGKFPFYKNIDEARLKNNHRPLKEEHRICFVCISRARKICYLLRSKIYNIPTRNGVWRKPHTASRFWTLLFSYCQSIIASKLSASANDENK